jgi:hypothetical protein
VDKIRKESFEPRQQTFYIGKRIPQFAVPPPPPPHVCLKGPTNIKIFINNFFLILAIKEQHILDTYAGKQLSLNC